MLPHSQPQTTPSEPRNPAQWGYKDTLSGFETWEQKGHASEWILLPQNTGKEHGIDETIHSGLKFPKKR